MLQCQNHVVVFVARSKFYTPIWLPFWAGLNGVMRTNNCLFVNKEKNCTQVWRICSESYEMWKSIERCLSLFGFNVYEETKTLGRTSVQTTKKSGLQLDRRCILPPSAPCSPSHVWCNNFILRSFPSSVALISSAWNAEMRRRGRNNLRLQNFFQRQHCAVNVNGYLQPQNPIILTWNNWLCLLPARKDEQCCVGIYGWK